MCLDHVNDQWLAFADTAEEAAEWNQLMPLVRRSLFVRGIADDRRVDVVGVLLCFPLCSRYYCSPGLSLL